MQTVIGLFDTAQQAQKAVEKLKSNGFTSNDIDTVTNASKNMTASAGKGTVNASDDTLGDKISTFFKNLFGDDDDEVDRYSKVANKAGCVVTVHAQSKEKAEQAAKILDENGSVDVNERASEYGYSANKGSTGDGDGKTLKVIKEDVQIGKREVETGGMKLRSRIVERPVEEKLRLREERVTVERQPVDRIATDADLKNFEEGEIEMTENAEVAHVSKEARVVEEVKLSKDLKEREETVHETARDTEVDEENLEVSNGGKKNKSKS